MERITQLIADLTEYDNIAEGLKAGKSPIEVTGLAPIHKANLTAALAGQLHKQAVVICADDLACSRITRDLEAFSERPVEILPAREFVFHNIESSSREYEHKRISALRDLQLGKRLSSQRFLRCLWRPCRRKKCRKPCFPLISTENMTLMS